MLVYFIVLYFLSNRSKDGDSKFGAGVAVAVVIILIIVVVVVVMVVFRDKVQNRITGIYMFN